MKIARRPKPDPVLALGERLKDGPWFMEHVEDEKGTRFLVVWDKESFVTEIGPMFGCATFDDLAQSLFARGFVLVEEAGDTRFITPSLDVPGVPGPELLPTRSGRKRKAPGSGLPRAKRPRAEEPVLPPAPVAELPVPAHEPPLIAPVPLADRVSLLETQLYLVLYQLSVIHGMMASLGTPRPAPT